MTIITLTTDFGTRDGYVGAMKGRILSLAPQSQLVDISHDIAPHDLVAAAWCLLRSTPQFPPQSIHLAVVDPGVGSKRAPIMLLSGGRWYIGPDNGIFSRVVERFGVERQLRLRTRTEWWQAHQSFDGLALFAPAAACVANGIVPERLGETIEDLHWLSGSEPDSTEERIRGQIVLFDRFGNGITNIDVSDLAGLKGEIRTVECRGHRFSLVDHYQAGNGRAGVAIINSDERLELAVFGRSAREEMGLATGDEVRVGSQSPRC
jgi:S-adenosyl-L-methionine hydrolase (adenosine-forming)